MDGYSISQAAERSGFPASTLRFYEQSGLLHPHRTQAGYRSYDERHLELLAFIGRAKGFGLSLDEITDLLALLADDRCAPVQDRLRDLVEGKIADAQQRIAELVTFTAELQRVSATLRDHTPDGPCDGACGCARDHLTGAAPGSAVGVALTEQGTETDPPIACTLAPEQVGDRVADWQRTLAGAVGREPIEGGVRARFPANADVGALATLAAAEQGCCRFFRFGLTIAGDGVTLDITGPPDAQPVLHALVEAPA